MRPDRRAAQMISLYTLPMQIRQNARLRIHRNDYRRHRSRVDRLLDAHFVKRIANRFGADDGDR